MRCPTVTVALRWSVLWAVLLGVGSEGPLLAAPEIAVVTEPACNGEVLVMTGEGLDPARTRVVALSLGEPADKPAAGHDPDQHVAAIDQRPALPATPPPTALPCEVLAGGERWLQVRMRCSRRPWIHAPLTAVLWAGDASGWSRPYLVNRPQAQWLAPAVAAPGEALRIFGRTFAWGWQLEPAVAYVRPLGGHAPIRLVRAPLHREDGHNERWCLAAWLPKDLAPGDYEVFVHGRHGGAWGWSDPLRLRVAPEPTVTGPTINVRTLGARGDGLTDDTDVLERAVTEAVRRRGLVLLPAGVYALSRTLTLPPHTVLRGETAVTSTLTNLRLQSLAPGLATDRARRTFRPALVHVPEGHVVLQDVGLRFTPATAPALQIGRDMAWAEDVSLFGVRVESRQPYGLSAQHDYADPPVSIYNCRRLRMIRCETHGAGGVGCARKVEDCQFAENRFLTDRRWRGLAFKFWGAERCIFEDNLMRGDIRGLVMQTHFGVNYRNFIAGNLVERTVLGGNAGETYLIEGAGLLYESAVQRATADSATTVAWPSDAEQSDAARFHQAIAGRFVVVARGRGLGQWRRIAAAAADTKTLRLETPWRVVPDSTSTVVVMNGLVETVFVNNQELDCDKGLYVYAAGAINNIIDRHLCQRSLGVTLMTDDDRQAPEPSKHRTAPDLFNLIRNCRIHDGGGVILAAGARLPVADGAHVPLAQLGNRVIGNEVQRVRPFFGAQYDMTWRSGGGWSERLAALNVIPMDLGREPGTGLAGPARMIGNVFQDNYLSACPIGVGISRRAAGTLLLENVFQECRKRLDDRGAATREVASELRDEQPYTPEKSPVR
jgi:hypothetical protein